jgi:glutathione S-transferase
LYEGTRDFNSAFISYGFLGWNEVLDKAKVTTLPKYLPVYERVLQENKASNSLYLVGTSLSLADVGLLEPLLSVEELLGASELEQYPALRNFLANIKELPQIRNYLTTQRPKKNDPEYINEVTRVLWG